MAETWDIFLWYITSGSEELKRFNLYRWSIGHPWLIIKQAAIIVSSKQLKIDTLKLYFQKIYKTNTFRGGRISCSGARNRLFETNILFLTYWPEECMVMFGYVWQNLPILKTVWSCYGDWRTLLCHHYTNTCVCVYWNLRIVNCLTNRKKKHCWHLELNRLQTMPMREKTMHTCLNNNHSFPTRHAITKCFSLRHHWLYRNLISMLILAGGCRLCVSAVYT